MATPLTHVTQATHGGSSLEVILATFLKFNCPPRRAWAWLERKAQAWALLLGGGGGGGLPGRTPRAVSLDMGTDMGTPRAASRVAAIPSLALQGLRAWGGGAPVCRRVSQEPSQPTWDQGQAHPGQLPTGSRVGWGWCPPGLCCPEVCEMVAGWAAPALVAGGAVRGVQAWWGGRGTRLWAGGFVSGGPHSPLPRAVPGLALGAWSQLRPGHLGVRGGGGQESSRPAVRSAPDANARGFRLGCFSLTGARGFPPAPPALRPRCF